MEFSIYKLSYTRSYNNILIYSEIRDSKVISDSHMRVQCNFHYKTIPISGYYQININGKGYKRYLKAGDTISISDFTPGKHIKKVEGEYYLFEDGIQKEHLPNKEALDILYGNN